MHTGLDHIAYVLPHRVSVEELVHEAGLESGTADVLRRNGLQRVPVSKAMPLTVLVRQVLDAVCGKEKTSLIKVRGVIFAHSLAVLAPADVPFLNECLEGYGLETIPRIAVSGQPCSILHMAIQLGNGWLNSLAQDETILLLGADQAYSADERIFFGSAMGDAAVAAVIGGRAARYHILASFSQTTIYAFEGEASPPEAIAEFRKLNPLNIRYAIEACLSKAGLTLKDINCIVPHTPYSSIWDVMAELLRFPRELILTNYLYDTGHLNSNDVLVHYARGVEEGLIKEGQVALLVSPGFGGTRGCTLIRS